MLTHQYEAEASSTVPPQVHVDAVEGAVLMGLMLDFMKASERLNKYVKKPFIYSPSRTVVDEVIRYYTDNGPVVHATFRNIEETHFAHGVIGIATEAGECVEQLYGILFEGHKLDPINAKEEAGDLLWYMVRMLRASGFSLEDAMRANVAKLANRHKREPGQTFNPDADKNRDKDAERAILETAPKKQDQAYLGLATNLELETEIKVRRELGHTDPNYRTVDSE